jgi:hypothetical protein
MAHNNDPAAARDRKVRMLYGLILERVDTGISGVGR